MKAFYLEDYGKLAIRDIPLPEPRPGEALIRVKSVSICGSDVNAYNHKGTEVSCPLILGHECAGVIEWIDPGEAGGFSVGDQVLLDPYLACGHCYPCSIGHTNCCESLKVLGVQTHGAMCEFVAHPIRNLVKPAKELPWEIAPLVEPLTISIHALRRANLRDGEHVVICGAGAIGTLAALAAGNYYGAIPILVDVLDARLDFARSLGIAHTINPAREDAVSAIREITSGRMAEVVVEASGANSAIRATLDYASYCGRIALTGWPSRDTGLPTNMITRKEIVVYGSRNSAREFHLAAHMVLSGIVDVKSILTKTVSFDELPEILADIAANPGNYMKVSALL